MVSAFWSGSHIFRGDPMALASLHSWCVHSVRGESLYALEDDDRFGPYCVCRDADEMVIAPNMSHEDAIDWVAQRIGVPWRKAQSIVGEAVKTWMVQRAQRAWSLRTAKPSCQDTGACGQ